MSATVRDVMTARVVAVREDATFKEMADMLGTCRVSAFPVIDAAGKVIGVVSEADLLGRLAHQDGHAGWLDGLMHPRDHDKPAAVVASELMTGPAVTIGPDQPVRNAARLMYDRRVKRLPVVNDIGRLIGIISRADVLSVFRRSDDEIRREATAEVILGRFLVDPDSMTVAVRDGILTISGRPETDEVGHEIVTALRHLEGVVAVRDRLHYASVEKVTW
jgi:CBS domain-containing protein